MTDQHSIFGQNKLLNHPAKIDQWLRGDENSVVTVEMDLTNRCNNACPGCVGGRTDRNAEMTTNEALKVIHEMKEFGVSGLVFSGGGDPLLHKNFNYICHAARYENLFDIGLITNGLALSEDNIWVILMFCQWIRISLDAGSPALYRKTHGVDTFDKVLANISELVRAKRERKADTTIGIGFLTRKDTLYDMENFLKIATELGVDYAQFRPYHGDFTPGMVERCKALQEDYPVCTASWQKYSHFEDEDKRPYGKCYGRFFRTVIGADMNVYVCCHLRGMEKYVIGNLRNESFADIWRRRRVNIDFNDCPYFCICDESNRLLWDIAKPKEHINFI